MSEKDDVWTISLYGLIATVTDDKTARKVADTLELYLRRNGVGIAIDGREMRFVELVREEETK